MIKWILTTDKEPPRGQDLVVGWFNKPGVRTFEGATINYDAGTFYMTVPDFWVPLKALGLPKEKQRRTDDKRRTKKSNTRTQAKRSDA